MNIFLTWLIIGFISTFACFLKSSGTIRLSDLPFILLGSLFGPAITLMLLHEWIDNSELKDKILFKIGRK